MNTFNLYKNTSDYNIADSLANIFAAQETEKNSEKTLDASDISNPAVKTILAKFPAAENKVTEAGGTYAWKDKSGHSVSVAQKSKSDEYTLAINHNFAGIFSNSQWEVSDTSGLSVIASVVSSLTRHADVLESRNPSLLREVDTVLSFIETEFLKTAEDPEGKYEDVDMSGLSDDELIDVDMSDVDNDKPIDVDVSDLSKNSEVSAVIDRIVDAHTSGSELSYAIDVEFAPLLEREGPASEAKMKKNLFLIVEDVANKAADEAENELESKFGMSKAESEDLGSKVYYKVSELLAARAENLLELSFERMPKTTTYKRRKDLLQEHISDPETSRIRESFSE